MFSINRPVVLDINTQGDLFDTHGAYTLHDAGKVLPVLRQFFNWVASNSIPIVSTRLHQVIMPDQRTDQPIGVPNTPRYAKLSFTILRSVIEMPLDCGTDFPVQGFDLAQQYVFDLPQPNPFESPRLDRLLSESEAPCWLVVGGPLESSVRMAVLGLLQRRQKVAVIKDGLAAHDSYEGQMAMRQIESKNIDWLSCQEAIEKYSTKPSRRSNAIKSRSRNIAGIYRAMRGVDSVVRAGGGLRSVRTGNNGRSLRH